MLGNTEIRVIEEARYIVDNHATVRECGKAMGVSKSTVHKDVTQHLYNLDRNLFNAVRAVLDNNKEERHIRGGIATKNKYLELREHEKVLCET